jgi:hypothetical protein
VRWTITGTEGEIKITVPESTPWHLEDSATFKMYSAQGEIEDVDFRDAKVPAYIASVKYPATNTAHVYEAFSAGAVGNYATFELALVHHCFLDTILKNYK